MSDIVVIRPYKPGDEIGMVEARLASIRTNAAKDYTPEQIVAWTSKVQPDDFVKARQKDGEHFWVLDDNGRIGGFASWLHGKIQAFYMHPDYTGRKHLGRYTSKLFKATENDMLAQTHTDACEIEGTLTARKFYERMGFQVTGTGIHKMDDGTVTDVLRFRKDYSHEQIIIGK